MIQSADRTSKGDDQKDQGTSDWQHIARLARLRGRGFLDDFGFLEKNWGFCEKIPPFGESSSFFFSGDHSSSL